MKKIVSRVSILTAVIFAAFTASAQNSTAPAEPKAVVAPDKMQQTKNTATDASSASERAKSDSAAASFSKPKPETIFRRPNAMPQMKELNPQKAADIKPTPKIAPLPSKG